MEARKPLVFEGSKREFYEVEDGTIFCDRRGCPGSKGLRDHRNGVPICAKCAVRTAVGYISKDTAREHQNIFFTATPTDYIITGVTAFIASLFAGFFISLIGFFYIAFLASVPAGGFVSEMVYRVSRKRRGRYTGQVVGVAMALSVVLLFLVSFIGIIFVDPISLGIYAFLGIGAAVSRFQLGLRF